MPQMNKGGKFVFGKSNIQASAKFSFPSRLWRNTRSPPKARSISLPGSKVTGGFCVTRKGLLLPSKLGHILAALPDLLDYTAEEGSFLPYKGRSYCWLSVTADGLIRLTKPMMDFLRITPGMRLLSIRSSDIAFTMGAGGRFWKRRIAIMA